MQFILDIIPKLNETAWYRNSKTLFAMIIIIMCRYVLLLLKACLQHTSHEGSEINKDEIPLQKKTVVHQNYLPETYFHSTMYPIHIYLQYEEEFASA